MTIDMTPFQQGYSDYCEGKDCNENPYSYNFEYDYWLAWTEGHMEAYVDMECK